MLMQATRYAAVAGFALLGIACQSSSPGDDPVEASTDSSGLANSDSGGDSDGEPTYAVLFVETGGRPDDAIETIDVAGAWIGEFAIDGDLSNPALPANTSPLGADYLWVARADDRDAAEQLFDEAMDALGELEPAPQVRAGFLAQVPPELAVFPPIEALPATSPDAFVLINAIALAPDGAESFDAYSAQAVPMALAAGTAFAAPLSPIEVLEGQWDFDFLALTLWAGAAEFEAFHHDEAFLEVATLRSAAVADFVEARARPR